MHYTELYEGILQELRRVFEELKEASLTAFVETIKSHNRIFFIGVGREGMVTRAFAMRLMHMGKSIFWVWDDTTPAMEKGDLLVATSGSGEIGHIDYVCRKAKEHGAFVCLITGSPSGDTAKHTADQILFIPAAVYLGKDEVVPSCQPMGNLFEQTTLLILDMVIMLIENSEPDISFASMARRHRNVE